MVELYVNVSFPLDEDIADGFVAGWLKETLDENCPELAPRVERVSAWLFRVTSFAPAELIESVFATYKTWRIGTGSQAGCKVTLIVPSRAVTFEPGEGLIRPSQQVVYCALYKAAHYMTTTEDKDWLAGLAASYQTDPFCYLKPQVRRLSQIRNDLIRREGASEEAIEAVCDAVTLVRAL